MPANTDKLDDLVALTHHRWNIPVIAELQRSNGAKHVTLLNRLQLGRASLSASLKSLINQGFVRRSQGYGHPMRPEYLLSAKGERMGQDCVRLVEFVQRDEEEKLAFSKWTLPLLAAIGDHTLRFGEIRKALNGSSPRAIALALKEMQNQSWIDRIIVAEFPPAAGYRLRRKGRQVQEILSLICANLQG